MVSFKRMSLVEYTSKYQVSISYGLKVRLKLTKDKQTDRHGKKEQEAQRATYRAPEYNVPPF